MKIVLRQVGEKVLINMDDRLFVELSWEAAQEFSAALKAQALKAEAHAKAEQIIHDSAILARAGVPFTLSDNPRMLDEVAKEAAWNRDLRRAMPGGVKSEERFGLPRLLQAPPKKRNH